ncbi:MAG: Maf-like protein [Hyphomicrobiales bacterium]|nr:MAG: Maf-like protein [Hyphomicrobiales bacterium]
MNETNIQLILASKSPYRAQLLKNVGLTIESRPSNVDERAVEAPLLKADLEAGDIAEILAQAKATNVSEKFPDAYVIGCDQTLSLNEELLHKPIDMEEARHRLLQMSGKTHLLNSAVVLVRNGQILWSHVEIARMKMRDLDPGFIGRHLAKVGDIALTSVGAYQIEAEGLQLFEEIAGDYFTIMGLPLLPLLSELRKRKLMDA